MGDDVSVDVSLDSAKPDDYDAPLLPGGVLKLDKLRTEPKAVQFVKIFRSRKAGWGYLSRSLNAGGGDVVRGRTVTS